jgi:hypothetical protein
MRAAGKQLAPDELSSRVEALDPARHPLIALFEVTAGNLARAGELYAAASSRIAEITVSTQLLQHLAPTVDTAGALIAIAETDLATAEQRAADGYANAMAIADMPLLALTAAAAIELALARRNPARAAELLGAVAVVRGAEDPTSVQFRAAAGRLRAALGDDGFEASYARGRALSRESALSRLDPASG